MPKLLPSLLTAAVACIAASAALARPTDLAVGARLLWTAEDSAQPVVLERIASRRSKSEAAEPPAESREDLPGRYAVMREKHDTGCMITLDKSRSTGSDRAQLAPGCRDQGIVIFDPSSWQLVKGQLVLTAKAGHKTKLEKAAEGRWEKDAKEGGKPLGLKKL